VFFTLKLKLLANAEKPCSMPWQVEIFTEQKNNSKSYFYISPSIRAERLETQDFIRLANGLEEHLHTLD